MGLHVGTYSGGTWKNEEMTSDKYPPALCKRLREEEVPFDLLWLDSTWRLFNTTYGNGGCCLNGVIRSKIRKPCLIVAMRKM